ncbi:c-type heme family protein [Flavobacterium sp. RSB2_4_14]|uniref:c-type heme family protein n=1 Tax=Flavobacterium sp. RSB2_4_14 TaxID=3447665 RepID=UPI003F2B8C4F
MKKTILLLASITFFSCNKKNENYKPVNEKDKLEVSDNLEGKKLIETHCYLCHSPNAPEGEGRIAPPMVAIKARYINKEGFNKEEFITALKSFVENPTEDKALMFGAVKKHGLMPKQVFPEESLDKIANYMFDYQIEEPEWFKSHWESHGNEKWTQSGKKLAEKENPKTVDEIGLEYALSTKKVLGKNLMGAIQKKGTLAALEFCNIKAMPLTDSMATKHNAIIKRVSDKNRNPNNKANVEELKYIAQFKADLLSKNDSKPVVIEKGNKVQFYYPIPTNTMCLQCHGKQIKPEIQKQILKLYPNDLAVGYSENEIRGMWSITFDKNK